MRGGSCRQRQLPWPDERTDLPVLSSIPVLCNQNEGHTWQGNMGDRASRATTAGDATDSWADKPSGRHTSPGHAHTLAGP